LRLAASPKGENINYINELLAGNRILTR